MLPALSADALPEGTPGRLGVGPVSDLVVWLSSAECEVNGRIFIAGGGVFRRARMIQNRGLENPDATPEFLADHAEELCRMDELLGYEDTPSMLRDIAERARALERRGRR